MCYGVGVELRDEASVRYNVEANSAAGFSDVIAIENDKCLNMTVMSNQPASELKSGAVRVAKIKFKAVEVASGTIRINKERSKVVGVNVGEVDKEIEIGTVNGRSYIVTEASGPTVTPGPTAVPTAEPTVVPTVVPTEEPGEDNPILNFKMSYLGLRNNDAVCGQDWKVNLMVLGDGETRAYSQVPLVKTSDTAEGGEVIFAGGLELEGFSLTENLGAFIKGPMHLQVKYGVDGQEGFYSQSGGEISVTNDPDTSPFNDFSAYPVLAGDVTGAAVGIPDGRVDGRDFNYVKSKVTIDKSLLSDGDKVNGDFDGDCWIGNVDLVILMISLKDKQDQLY